MKRFLKIYAASLVLLGLFAVLCMGWPAGMPLLLVFGGARSSPGCWPHFCRQFPLRPGWYGGSGSPKSIDGYF